MFLGFVTDTRYGWTAVCHERFGEVPQQVFLGERITIAHTDDY
ncbi:hypothetical protein GCM10010252_61100 [Streptomyces aureoverticillatus]|nr:hypothetical protein GCM10010252_61100 [Streptomyces aureoverticillatus]